MTVLNAPRQRDRWVTVALFLVVFLGYLVTSSREWPRADARPVYEVAESLIERGELAIGTRWRVTLPSPDGKTYAVAPLLQSLVHLPSEVLRYAVARRSHFFAEVSRGLAGNIAAAWLGGLAAVLFFRLCLREGAGGGMALLSTLALAFGTMLWVWGRTAFSEVLQAACLIGFLSAVLAFRAEPSKLRAVLVGLAAGLLANAKLILVMVLPGAALFLLWRLRRRWRELPVLAGCAAAPFLLLAAVMLYYNHRRYGAFLAHGYDLGGPVMKANPLHGLFGMFLSPNRSVLLYAPPLVFSLLALPPLVRRRPDVAALLVLTLVPLLWEYGRFIHWAGDWSWGPRYLVAMMPALLLPAALAGGELLAAARRSVSIVKRAVLVGVLALGLFVQILGCAFAWEHDYFLVRPVRSAWLGNANGVRSQTQGAFEDWYALHWLLPFNPLHIRVWLLRHVPAGHDGLTAEKDAPWRRYTELPLPFVEPYRNVRFDWWFLEYKMHFPRIGAAMLAAMLAGLLGAIAALTLAWRRPRGAAAAAEPAQAAQGEAPPASAAISASLSDRP